MKKRSIIVLFVVFAVCLCTGVSCSCNGSQSKYPDLPPEKAQTMELEVASKTLAVDESFYLNVSGTNGLTPSFSVDDESVASVDRTGKVVALSIGTATITVSVGGENRKCYITVVAEKSIPVLKVKNVISEDGRYSLPVGLNDVYALNVSLLFKGAAVSGRINYSSTDPSVATVNDNGEVRAVGTGSATIVIYAEYEGRYQKETHTEIAVTVTDASWYFRLDDEDVYTLPSYNGVDYKNQVGFDAKLYLGGLEYGLDQLTVTVKESDVAEVADGVITGLKAGTTDIEVSYTADGKTYKTWRTLTVHAVETDYREDPAYSLCIEKRAAGDQVLTLPIAPETDEFSLRIGGKEIEIKNYDKTTREATIDSSQLLAVGDNNDLYGSIGNGVTVARFKVISIDYVLKTAEDFESKFNTEFFDDTANGGSLYAYYSFALNNDIDMAGKIINNAMWPDNANNSYNGTIDGRGHVIYNLTFNPALYDSYGGLINYKAGYGSVVKDIAFVNMTTPRAFITNKADGLVLRNVYISGTCEWGEVFDEAHSSFGNVTVENVIINSDAELFDSKWSENVTINNVINMVKYPGGLSKFFTDHADGLGDEWADSGFTVDSEGLKFHGTLLLEKVLPAPAISLASESDLNSKYLKNGNDSYELTSDINCSTGTSITYKSWVKFNGTLDGNGHVIKDPVIDDDITSYGILGKETNGGKVKDIAIVNATNSYRGYLAETAEDLTVENAYFSGTFGINDGWNDIIQEAKGNVVFRNVIIDCYGVYNGGYAPGKAGTGADNVIYENVITLDKNNKGERDGSEYGGTLMTYEEFFTTYADGLGDEWENSGFTVDEQGLKFHGTLVLAKA